MPIMSVDEMDSVLGREGNLSSCSSFQHIDQFPPKHRPCHCLLLPEL